MTAKVIILSEKYGDYLKRRIAELSAAKPESELLQIYRQLLKSHEVKEKLTFEQACEKYIDAETKSP